MSIEHIILTKAAGLHEPKGVEDAAWHTVYVADGTGSGVWEEYNNVADYITTGQLYTFESGTFTTPSLTEHTPISLEMFKSENALIGVTVNDPGGAEQGQIFTVEVSGTYRVSYNIDSEGISVTENKVIPVLFTNDNETQWGTSANGCLNFYSANTTLELKYKTAPLSDATYKINSAVFNVERIS